MRTLASVVEDEENNLQADLDTLAVEAFQTYNNFSIEGEENVAGQILTPGYKCRTPIIKSEYKEFISNHCGGCYAIV